jgi:hypothetical protein
VEDYVRKGGTAIETEGRQCVCNGLTATIGLAQVRPGEEEELPLVTAGNDVANIADFLRPGQDSYTAADVVSRLLSGS